MDILWVNDRYLPTLGNSVFQYGVKFPSGFLRKRLLKLVHEVFIESDRIDFLKRESYPIITQNGNRKQIPLPVCSLSRKLH